MYLVEDSVNATAPLNIWCVLDMRLQSAMQYAMLSLFMQAVQALKFWRVFSRHAQLRLPIFFPVSRYSGFLKGSFEEDILPNYQQQWCKLMARKWIQISRLDQTVPQHKCTTVLLYCTMYTSVRRKRHLNVGKHSHQTSPIFLSSTA